MEKPSGRFVNDLHQWYNRYKRDLPWRRTTAPYKILVSEVMLQQTQVDRVIPKYEIFLESFPTLKDLANATPARVIAIWQGLGYNRRALNLQKAARTIMETKGGMFPKDPAELQTIPGIGPYTASAVASFAFNQDTAVVDTNVIRIFARIFVGKKALKSDLSRGQFDQLANDLLPKGSSRLHNNAIMEFGALICRAKPACASCFASSYCTAFQENWKGLITESDLALLGTPHGGFGTVQSRFEGSDRQVRGRIVARLRDGHDISLKELWKMLKMDLRTPLPYPRFVKIISALSNDELVSCKKGNIRLPDTTL